MKVQIDNYPLNHESDPIEYAPRAYSGELLAWLLFTVSLAALCFALGFVSGFVYWRFL